MCESFERLLFLLWPRLRVTVVLSIYWSWRYAIKKTLKRTDQLVHTACLPHWVEKVEKRGRQANPHILYFVFAYFPYNSVTLPEICLQGYYDQRAGGKKKKKKEQIRTVQVEPKGSDSSAMIRNPHLTGAINLYIIRFQYFLSWNAVATRRKRKPKGCVFRCKNSKYRRKRKWNDVFNKITANHEVPSRRVWL